MVEAFCGTWKLIDSQNFDEYMKAIGEFFPDANIENIIKMTFVGTIYILCSEN